MPEVSSLDSRPYLRVTDLTKNFGEFTALANVSLGINEGEFVCFLGPSGCGKTTLLRAIAGLDIQTSGTVEQDGRDISALPPSERDFGIVFQSYALFPNLTVRSNVAYGLHGRSLSKPDMRARVAELLELVGLPEQGEKYPAQLSGGQQQRIALARALATSPGLLLLDEPLSALDAKVRVHLRKEIKDLQRRLGVTTVMVTHDQEEALTMADRIVVMDHGVIEQVGDPLTIYQAPRTAFVADFIGAMNFLPGRYQPPGMVRVGSLDLACNPAEDLPATDVQIAVRPEEIELSEKGATRGGGNDGVAAQIVAGEFLGSFYRMMLSVPQLQTDGLNADFSAEQVRNFGLKSGDTVYIRLSPEHVRVFPLT